MDIARHVRGCRLTQDTRVSHAFDDVASTIDQTLPQVDHLLAREPQAPLQRVPLRLGVHSAGPHTCSSLTV